MCPAALWLAAMASAWIFFAVSLFINILAWLFSALLETEVFYDLTGGITFLVIGSFSYWFRAKSFIDGASQSRQGYATLMLVVWAARLSSFLCVRAMRDGDRRLAKYRTDPLAFLVPFSLQSLWCTLNALPVLLLNSSGSDLPVGGAWDTAALLLWVLGHGVEIVADVQKWLFRSKRENRAKFIRHGLWAYSRHPNYFGQIVLQWALMAFCLPAIYEKQGVASLVLALLSPGFETALLLYISGVPLLEKAADDKWGDDVAYKRYKETVSVLVPWKPKAMPGGGKRKFYEGSSSA